jgi:hypothetical protein
VALGRDGTQLGDRPPASGNDEDLPPLGLLDDLRQMRLRFENPDFLGLYSV